MIFVIHSLNDACLLRIKRSNLRRARSENFHSIPFRAPDCRNDAVRPHHWRWESYGDDAPWRSSRFFCRYIENEHCHIGEAWFFSQVTLQSQTKSAMKSERQSVNPFGRTLRIYFPCVNVMSGMRIQVEAGHETNDGCVQPIQCTQIWLISNHRLPWDDERQRKYVLSVWKHGVTNGPQNWWVRHFEWEILHDLVWANPFY